jgi:hypothetical protein
LKDYSLTVPHACLPSPRPQSGSLTEYIEESRIPTSLLVVLMGQFGLLLFDRVVYLTRALELKVVLQVTVVIGV